MVNELNLRILPQQAYNEQSILAYLRQEKGINAKAVRVVKRSITNHFRQFDCKGLCG